MQTYVHWECRGPTNLTYVRWFLNIDKLNLNKFIGPDEFKNNQ
jgi:hypothetical protein